MHIIWFGKKQFIPALYVNDPESYIHEHYDNPVHDTLLKRLHNNDFELCDIDEHGRVKLPQWVLSEVETTRAAEAQQKAEFREHFQFKVCPECGYTAPSFPRDMRVSFYVVELVERRSIINHSKRDVVWRSDMPTYCPQCGLMVQHQPERRTVHKKTRSEVWGKGTKMRW